MFVRQAVPWYNGLILLTSSSARFIGPKTVTILGSLQPHLSHSVSRTEIYFKPCSYPNQIKDDQWSKEAKYHAETSSDESRKEQQHVVENSHIGARSLVLSFLAAVAK